MSRYRLKTDPNEFHYLVEYLCQGSPSKVAYLAGVSTRSVYNLYEGKSLLEHARISTVQSLLAVFGLSCDEFFSPSFDVAEYCRNPHKRKENTQNFRQLSPVEIQEIVDGMFSKSYNKCASMSGVASSSLHDLYHGKMLVTDMKTSSILKLLEACKLTIEEYFQEDFDVTNYVQAVREARRQLYAKNRAC